jgi:hypothetical protein
MRQVVRNAFATFAEEQETDFSVDWNLLSDIKAGNDHEYNLEINEEFLSALESEGIAVATEAYGSLKGSSSGSGSGSDSGSASSQGSGSAGSVASASSGSGSASFLDAVTFGDLKSDSSNYADFAADWVVANAFGSLKGSGSGSDSGSTSSQGSGSASSVASASSGSGSGSGSGSSSSAASYMVDG